MAIDEGALQRRAEDHIRLAVNYASAAEQHRGRATPAAVDQEIALATMHATIALAKNAVNGVWTS
jgi:hypothetical protein